MSKDPKITSEEIEIHGYYTPEQKKELLCIGEKCKYYSEHEFNDSWCRCLLGTTHSFTKTSKHICDIEKHMERVNETYRFMQKTLASIRVNQE